MKKTFLILLLSNILNGFAQTKPMIDSAAIVNWPSIGSRAAISADGKYFMYTIGNKPVGKTTLIVQSTFDGWKKSYVGVSQGLFAGNNKQFIFQKSDTLFFLGLGGELEKSLPKVAGYNQSKNGVMALLALITGDSRR